MARTRVVVYTVLTGSKEALGDPLEGLAGKDLESDLALDWVCFTDDPALTSPRWQMRLLDEPLPPERLSRRPKMLPHEYLPSWDYSLYIDNIVRFKHAPTQADLFGDAVPGDGALLRAFRHSTRNEPVNEAEAIVQLGYEGLAALVPQLEFYKAQGWLQQIEQLSTCTLMLRAHQHPKIRRHGEIWWQQFLLWGKRDQMSFDIARLLAGCDIDYWPAQKNDCAWLVNTANITSQRVLANFDPVRYRWRYRKDPEAQTDPRRHYREQGVHDGRNHARRLEVLDWLCWRHGASLGSQVAPRRSIAQTLDEWLAPRRVQGGRLLVLGVHDVDSQDTAAFADDEIDAGAKVLSAYLGRWQGARFDLSAQDLAQRRHHLNDTEGRFAVVIVLGCPGPLVPQLLPLLQDALVQDQGLLIVACGSPVPTPLLPALEASFGRALGATVQAAVQGSQHDDLDAPLRNSLLALAWQRRADAPPSNESSEPDTMSSPAASDKLYIAYCTSGLGNRLRPLAAALAYCQATGRKLKVYWDDVTPNGCLTPWSDLFTTRIEPITLDEIAALDASRVALFTEKGPGHGVEREATRHERPQLRSLAQRGARLANAQALRVDEAADIVVVYDNDYLQQLPRAACIEALRSLNPHPAIRAKVIATVAGQGLRPDTPAVHARGTDFNMKEALATYSALIDERIPQGPFFLSTEDAALEAGLRERYGARVRSRPDRLHLQLKEGKTSWSDPDSYTITREHGIDALVDIYLLSSVQLVVYHPGSTFAEIARHLHGLLQGLPAPVEEGARAEAGAAVLAAEKLRFAERARALLPRGGAHPLNVDGGPPGPLAPEQLPPSFLYWESLGYQIPMTERLFMNSFSGQPELGWDAAVFKQLAAIPYEKFPRDLFARLCPYPEAWSQMDVMRGYLRGKKVLVIGSETFWIELLCVLGQAAEVTTVEYRPIHWNESPPAVLRTVTWDDFVGDLDAHKARYDLILSYSSIEHSGLGRYGDRLTPLGDLFTFQLMARCMKPSGLCAVAVPTGQDLTHFNAHRIYGTRRIRALEQISALRYLGIVFPDAGYLADDPVEALRGGWTLPALAQLPLGQYRQPILCFAREGFSVERYQAG